MKVSVQIEVTELGVAPATKETVAKFLDDYLSLRTFNINNHEVRIDSVRLITGARPIVKEPDAITPH
jgi:hypothetical protein